MERKISTGCGCIIDGDKLADYYTPYAIISNCAKRLSMKVDGSWLESEMVGTLINHFIVVDTSTDDNNVIYADGMPLIFMNYQTFKEYALENNLINVELRYIGHNVYFNRVLVITKVTLGDIYEYFYKRIDLFDTKSALPKDLDHLLYELDKAYFKGGECIDPEKYKSLFSRIIFQIAYSRVCPATQGILDEYKWHHSKDLCIDKLDE